MKQIVYFLLATSLTCGFWACGNHAHSDDANQAHKVANIAWKDLAHMDTVQLGDTVTYGYVFFNTGWKPVKLENAKARTGNITFRLPTKETLVGEQDTLWATSIFSTPGQNGHYFDVTHNTPQRPFLLALHVWVEDHE
ncbi:MAG TPA: DUF1573 domain-containing protein [Bacteroidetes bacterium]|nr:DUF1573 domain-containing protein [Bacteroidota bacterium]